MGKPASKGFDPKAFLSKVGAGKTILEFEKNEHIFEQGDVADAVFYIQKGNVKLTVLSEHGKEAVVGLLEPGQFFGEGCLNGHPLRIATFMNKFRKLGLISYNGKIEVHNSLLNAVLREKPEIKREDPSG